jgi:RNA polymerase sigma-70 factor, ECF subfamily
VTDDRQPRNGDVTEAVAEPALGLSRGRPAAEPFEALYRRVFPRVYAYVASLLRDRSAAEEVTAQAFERAYRKRSTYRPGRGSAEAWVFGIARHAALDELRRRKRRATLEGDPEDVHGTSPEDHAEAVVRRETVRAALAELDPRDRELVVLKFHGGLSNTEIARVLGLSESNVGTKLHRTMEKLRRDVDHA